jgi:hypothetical protein
MMNSNLVLAACLLGILAASALWLHLLRADLVAQMTPEEREQFEKEANDDMGW